nr:hypothetical protein [Coprothermobacter platensis]
MKGGNTTLDAIWSILWLIVIFSALSPAIHQRYLEAARQSVIHQLERKRRSRLITLIHRQENVSLLGVPIARYITMEDSEAVLTAIRSTPPNVPIDLVLHTPGGLVLAAEQIARALYNHPAKTTVIIPHYAMSGGTLIALAADEIIMDKHAVIGPLDPQINNMPAASIVRAVKEKGVQNVDDETLILADISEKALEQVKNTVRDLLNKHMDDEKAEEVADLLCQGHFTHDNPIFPEQAKALNLNVNTNIPSEVFDLLMLYPQPGASQRSVSYTRSDESLDNVPTIRYK